MSKRGLFWEQGASVVSVRCRSSLVRVRVLALCCGIHSTDSLNLDVPARYGHLPVLSAIAESENAAQQCWKPSEGQTKSVTRLDDSAS
jgi:hypothetical protein